MSVKIRLSLIGKKHVPFFSIVAVDSRKKRDGKFLDTMGTYNALKGEVVDFNEEIYQKWIAQGALPTDSAKKIFNQYKKDMRIAKKGKKSVEQEKKVTKKEKSNTSNKAEKTEKEKV